MLYKASGSMNDATVVANALVLNSARYAAVTVVVDTACCWCE
jgi:hypothetical protein